MDSISLINAHLHSERQIDLLLDIVNDAEEGKASRVLISCEKQFSEVDIHDSDLPEILEVQRVNRCNAILVFSILMYIATIQPYTLFTPHAIPIPVGHFFLFNTPAHFAVPVRNTSTVMEFRQGQLGGCKRTNREYVRQSINLFVKPNDSCFLHIISRDVDRTHKIRSYCSVSVSNICQPFFLTFCQTLRRWSTPF